MFAHLPQAWQACIEAFLAAIPSVTGRQTYKSTLVCFFRDLQVSPGDVTGAEISAFINSPSHARQFHGQPSESTIRRRVSILTSFYRHAIRTGLYQHELPTKGMRPSLPLASPADDPFGHLPPEWQECIEQFLTGIRNISGSTKSYDSYRGVLVRFFRARQGSPADVTKAEVLTFMNMPSSSPRNAGDECAASTKNGRRTTLQALYLFASDYEVNGSPLFDKALPTRRLKNLKTARPYRNMSTDEIKAFLAAINRETLQGKRDYALFWSFFLTARRRSELVGLRLGDITQTVFIEHGVARNGYTYQYVRKGHQREIAQAELDVSAWDAIHTWLADSGRLATMRPTDPIFTPLRQGQGRKDGATNVPLAGATVNALFKAYCRKAGLPAERLSVHSLRHASAHERELAGQSVQEISAALDHADVAITWRYLARLHGKADHGQASLAQRFAFLR